MLAVLTMVGVSGLLFIGFLQRRQPLSNRFGAYVELVTVTSMTTVMIIVTWTGFWMVRDGSPVMFAATVMGTVALYTVVIAAISSSLLSLGYYVWRRNESSTHEPDDALHSGD